MSEFLMTPEPHYIPGYTGHCPEYVLRAGETYGSMTHKILLDPSVHHAEQLILSDRTSTDYYANRVPDGSMPELSKGGRSYTYPMTPGYEGFLPRMSSQMGQRFTVEAQEALKEFEKQKTEVKQASNELNKIVAIQGGKYEPDVQDNMLVKSAFKLPLLEVRPEACGIIRNIPVAEPKPEPAGGGESPYFMEVLDNDKKFIPGYAAHIPFGYSKYGQGYAPYTNSALCDFTSNYRKRQSTEWAPVTVSRPDPPLMIQPTELYPKHIGMIPNYAGHVPGYQFRSGKTFANETRDAKRWLRGDFSL